MNNLYYQLQEAKDKYNLSYIAKDDEWLLFGELEINHKYKGVHHLFGKFYTHIILNKSFPDIIPVVKDLKKLIDDFHRNSDEELCLGCNAEIILKIRVEFNNQITVSQFIEKFIIPFYYSYMHYKKYGKVPYGERSHGALGTIEHYSELFNLKENYKIINMLEYLSNTKYKGHHLCPCGSENIIRRCHRTELLLLLQNVGINTIRDDYKRINDEIEYAKRLKRNEQLKEYKKRKQKKKWDYYLSKDDKLKPKFPVYPWKYK